MASEIVFPGILPRKWGEEFTKLELETIYHTLKFVLWTAHPETQKELIEEFKQVKSSAYVHWFLINFWQEIADLLAMMPRPLTSGELSDVAIRR